MQWKAPLSRTWRVLESRAERRPLRQADAVTWLLVFAAIAALAGAWLFA